MVSSEGQTEIGSGLIVGDIRDRGDLIETISDEKLFDLIFSESANRSGEQFGERGMANVPDQMDLGHKWIIDEGVDVEALGLCHVIECSLTEKQF